MLKDKLYQYMLTYISDYFFEISKSQLELAILSGVINLNQLKINSEKFNDIMNSYQLPFQLKAGIIDSLQIKVSP